MEMAYVVRLRSICKYLLHVHTLETHAVWYLIEHIGNIENNNFVSSALKQTVHLL